MIGCRLSHGLGRQSTQEGNRMRVRKGDKRHDLAAGEVVQRRKLCRDLAPRSFFSPFRQTTLRHTNFGDFILVSMATSLEDDRPTRR
jgi:hypothetical protein